MLTPFMIGWILADNLPFSVICDMTVDDLGGWDYFPEIAVGITMHNCDNQWEYDDKAGELLANQRTRYEVVM